MTKQLVYSFGNGVADGRADMKGKLGGKGANLAEMTNLGIPVPPGFTISTDVCALYNQNDKSWPEGLQAEVDANIVKLEQISGQTFGSKSNPLLVSVRSGAAISMPGMMDTVLNLGLNDEVVKGLAAKSGNPRFAYDSYRRFIQMFGDVVLGVENKFFEKVIDVLKGQKGVENDTDLTSADLQELIRQYKQIILDRTGQSLDQNPRDLLVKAINAVFESWDNDKAVYYRKMCGIPDDIGTAVNVQMMVFGNLGDTSGTGVAFTRDPSTGEKRFFGEFLMNAQGEDVVAGIRTPLPISQLQATMPTVYDELVAIYMKLEGHYRDMQDIEFTIQDSTLYMLQTRTGKRTAAAAIRIAVEMEKEGMIDKVTAVSRVSPEQVDMLLHPMLDPTETAPELVRGLPASPGAAVGKVVFHARDAVNKAEEGIKTILVRIETSPEDIAGMDKAEGILTARGGLTSHAAVVARGMGKCCVAGCGALKIDEERGFFKVGKVTIKEGDVVTLNGTTGAVFLGELKLITPDLSGDFEQIMEWADGIRRLKVRTNADTPHDAAVARGYGAEGIGLCRTEHMFFGEERIRCIQEMILAEDLAGRTKALAKLQPMQKDDFLGIFKAMAGLPVTIRLLDPPLHEFIPHTEQEISELAQAMGISTDHLRERRDSLKELNPMLGHRGCRLAVTYPEIYEMQVRAIMEAACDLVRGGGSIVPEIMIPLVGEPKEFLLMKNLVKGIADLVIAENGCRLEYMVGTMIEIPRAALLADQIAKEAEFFSFGTNDLTQMTFGYSRDDAGTFLPDYIDKKILPNDPFKVLDQAGVGLLVKSATIGGRAARPGLKVGICGEHGGEPSSVIFCHNIGLDYVSCSPYRVPIARLAAAHAVINEQ